MYIVENFEDMRDRADDFEDLSGSLKHQVNEKFKIVERIARATAQLMPCTEGGFVKVVDRCVERARARPLHRLDLCRRPEGRRSGSCLRRSSDCSKKMKRQQRRNADFTRIRPARLRRVFRSINTLLT